ncbi:hypothetical protein, partial [Rathayibacter tanaceti]|uniref:hypothetical protein n=1 Tax=Rathayibacter tanaceti TaxID=1671680 RepID=UPI001F2E2758
PVRGGPRGTGRFGLGSVFVDPRGDVVVVAGPESGVSGPPPSSMRGWLRGELTELSLAAAAAGESDAACARAAVAFDRGYAEAGGGPLDPGLLDAVVALRFALHQWDFHETHGSLPSSTDLSFLAWLLDRRLVDHSIQHTTTHRR